MRKTKAKKNPTTTNAETRFAQRLFAGAVVVCFACCLSLPRVLAGQDNSASPVPLDEAGMADELRRLAGICDSLDLKDEAILSRRWLPLTRADQQLLFLPSDAKKAATESAAKTAWSKHFTTARSRHAEYWWQETQKLLASGQEQAAYQAVWRTLRENPQHIDARRVLGGLLSGLDARARFRRSTTAHPLLAWPAGSYSRADTPHFQIATRADARQTEAFTSQVEAFYALWTQVFFPLWASPDRLRSRIAGGTADWDGRAAHQVVLLRSRKEYIEALGAKEENIGVSVGYYNAELKTSFFYPDPNLQATLFHELTHQLLAEATRIDAKPEAGLKSDYWLLEGIAIYMESLWNGTEYWTVGGWEAPRLQIARYRALRDGYWVPWEKFHSGGLDDWKKDSDVAKLYTQAAGLTHFFMDASNHIDTATPQPNNFSHREVFFRSLVSVYQGQGNTTELFSAMGMDVAQENYKRFLQVDDADVQALADDREPQELVLIGSHLPDRSWQVVGQHQSLRWLDVAFSNVQSQHVHWLPNLKSLRRLSFEGTAIDAQAVERAAKISLLEELDLSGCPINDAALQLLSNHRGLKTLWLTKTQVTDAVLTTLDSLPNLSFVDVQGSQISKTAWQSFLKSHPKITQ